MGNIKNNTTPRKSSGSTSNYAQSKINQIYSGTGIFGNFYRPGSSVYADSLNSFMNRNKNSNASKNSNKTASSDTDKKSTHTSSSQLQGNKKTTAQQVAETKSSDKNKYNAKYADNEYKNIKVSDLTASSNTEAHKDFYHSANLFDSTEFTHGIFTQRYRYGVLNPYQSLTTAREILFFTKPELNIFGKGDDYDSGTGLNNALMNNTFFTDLNSRYPDVLYALQGSCEGGKNCPFNNLLGNMVQSNLDVPSTSADTIETPANMYGVSYKYRGSSEAGDDNHTFSLEFKDTRYLPVYNFFKAYDIYEILKHHGVIRPKTHFIMNKILHDQYAIYKFILDEDMETIVFFAKYYGVKSMNLPRDVFNNTNFDNGLSYSIDFDAAFVEDSNPQILYDFNALAYPYFSTFSEDIPVFNIARGKVDMRAAKCAIIVKESAGSSNSQIVGVDASIDYSGKIKELNHVPGGTVYKLKWRGDQTV